MVLLFLKYKDKSIADSQCKQIGPFWNIFVNNRSFFFALKIWYGMVQTNR